MNRQLRAVLFDMDGVLINSAVVSNRLHVATAARHGVELSADEVKSLAGINGPQFWSYVKETYRLPGTVEEYWESYDAEAEVAAYSTDLIAPGVEELISALDSVGLLVGIVTSASCWRTGRVIELLSVADQISVVICSDDVEKPKPDAEPYLTAAKRLGVEAAGCLVVEDSRPGVQSALGAGMPVLVFAGFGEDPSAVEQAHGIVRSFVTESPTSIEAMHRAAIGTRNR